MVTVRLPAPRMILMALTLTASLLAGLGWGSARHHGLLAAPEAGAAAAIPAQSTTSRVPQTFLPVLNYQGSADVCRTWVAAQNVGQLPTRVVLLAWGEVTDCAAECKAPLQSECSGLLRPGNTWSFLGAQIPTGATGGILFSFNDRRLSDIGADLGFDDQVADYLCATLFFEVSGEQAGCEPYARFKAAADSGAMFAGVNLGAAAGSPLAVSVLRNCPGGATPGVEVGSTYEGLDAANAFRRSAALGAYVSYLAPVYAFPDDMETMLYLQNAGAECATAEVWLRSATDCAETLCTTLSLAPGTTGRVAATTCLVGSAWHGTVWVKSDQPVAMVADTVAGDVSATYTAHPPSLAGEPAPAGSPTLAYAPLVYDRQAGWETRLVVQNLSHGSAGHVKATFLDADGGLLSEQEANLCAHGTYTFQLAPTGSGASDRVGHARVESLASGNTAAVAIGVTALLLRYDGWPSAKLREAAAYPLIPGRAGSLTPGTGSGAGEAAAAVVAVPLFVKDLEGTGVATELVVQNLVRQPGTTEAVVLIYDANDLVQTRCLRLAQEEVSYIDLFQSASPLPGFEGTAIVSATSWRHEAAGVATNAVGLGAVVAARVGTRRGIDVPGDELALSGGVPLRRLPATAANTLFPCPQPLPPPAPATDSGKPAVYGTLYVPIMSFEGQDDVCRTVLTVTNSSAVPAKALLVAYGEPGFCGPQCAGPARVACSGLLAPGGTWAYDATSWPSSAKSAVVYGFNTHTLADLGVPGGGDELAVDWLCHQGQLAGDCAAARRLHLAYATGGTYEGIPLAQAYAAPLAAEVARTCPDAVRPGVEVNSRYTAPSGAHFDLTRPVTRGHWQSAATIAAEADGLSSILYVQNAGLACTTVTVKFQALDDCVGGRICRIFELSPGEVYQFDATDCLGPRWLGTVYLQSEEPLAIVVDTVGADILRTWAPVPSWSPYDLDDDVDVDATDLGILDQSLGATPGGARWNPRADLDHDGAVTAIDRDRFMRGGLCQSVPIPTPTSVVSPTPTPAVPPTPTVAPPTAPPTVVPPTATPERPTQHLFMPFAQRTRR